MDAKPPTLEMQRVYEKLKTLPGADSVAASSAPPVNGILLPTATLHVEGRGIPANPAEREAASATYLLVTENFFSTMKTPLVSGRSFDARDTSSAPWVAVINQTLARRFWPGENPIGKRFIVDAASGERVREVVGVVRDVPLQYVRTGPPRPVAYTLYRQQSERYLGGNAGMFGQMTFFVRSSRDPMSLVPAVKAAVAEVDSNRPPAGFQTLTSFVGTGMRTRGFYVSTLATFAFMATVLAALGIYNVVTLSVSQRTRGPDSHRFGFASTRYRGRSQYLCVAVRCGRRTFRPCGRIGSLHDGSNRSCGVSPPQTLRPSPSSPCCWSPSPLLPGLFPHEKHYA